MSTRRLQWLAILLPVAFWLLVLYLRSALFGEQRTTEGDLFALALIGIGAALFSTWVFRIVAQREAEVRRRSEQLAALREASLVLTSELDLQSVLQKVVDLARSLVKARYGALGVLEENGVYIQQFITSGITPQQRAKLGEPPRGHGVLGVLIKEGKPIRLPDIAADPRSHGFPPNHPPMHSLLGVPVTSKGRVIGDLYLTDKLAEDNRDGSQYAPFSEEDQQALEMFATQAAIAIENAQLYRQTQQLAIFKERERFGMDLHDGIIQSIYAIGLILEETKYDLEREPQVALQRVELVMHNLNDVIRDIRNYILDLRPQRFQGRDLRRGLNELARDLRANSFLTVNLHDDGVGGWSPSPEQTVEILHIAQEALGNVRKHARASRVDLTFTADDSRLVLTIEDDGIGIRPESAAQTSGHGLHNMRERAQALGGEAQIEARPEGGTRFTLQVPRQAEQSAA